ncbi:hypothetical protein [Sandarakinorhabdus sp.]|uniref:hypothetical protein n=1 Tax=Sandarakinorhabdus sp. TaxID=1916663 RepID=UPI00333E5208
MKNNFKSGLLFVSAIAVALTASSAAVAAPRWAKKAVKTVSKTATSTTNTVANNVSNATTDAASKGAGYANFAAAQAKGYADTEILEAANLEAKANKWSSLVAADTASAAMGFKNYAERMAADSMPVGRAEYAQIRTSALKNYSTAFSEASAKYEVARKNLVPVMMQGYSIANHIANTCNNSATGNWGKITPFVNKVTKFNPETQDAVYRLLRTLARGSRPDQQTATDMLEVGQALGMVTANGFALVGNAYQSNFSLSVGGSGGWIAGVNSSVSFAMDTFPTNGKYGMAVTVNAGVQVAAGTADLAPGATIGFGLGWGPGGAAEGEGQTLTAGGEAGGIDVAAEWTLPASLVQILATDVAKNEFSVNSLKNALTTTVTDSITTMCQAPAISAGVSIPTTANLGNVTFSPGYTRVVWKGSF